MTDMTDTTRMILVIAVIVLLSVVMFTILKPLTAALVITASLLGRA